MSYGVITYQDDVMMIAIHLAGYTWLDADKLRKAMGKKIPAEMQAQKEKLLMGFVEHGKLSKKVADELWALIEPFAAYGFNKAHAASYGRLAYQTAYMKANFPVEYMTAILTAESGDTEKIAEIISESKRMKIPILPPDVNASFGGFTIVDVNKSLRPSRESAGAEIRFGLYTIKNLGTDISDAIIAERETKGAYKSLADFLERIRHKNLNKKSYEALVKSGAMDGLGERGVMLANTEEALAYNKAQGQEMIGQESLFGMMVDQSSVPALRLKPAAPAAKKDCLIWEKELLGLFVSGHPLDEHREKLATIGTTIESIKTLRDGNVAVAGGIVEDIRTILTKKGDKMAFVKLTDMSGTLELVRSILCQQGTLRNPRPLHQSQRQNIRTQRRKNTHRGKGEGVVENTKKWYGKNMKKAKFEISLPITIFKEGKSFVAYSPALNLSTSAQTYEKAQSRFAEAVEIFFDELARMGTMDKVLAEMGWQKVKSNWRPPVVVSNYVQPMTFTYA